MLGVVNTLHSGSNAYATVGGDNFLCNLPTSQQPSGDVDDMSQDIDFVITKNIEQLYYLLGLTEGSLNRDIEQTDEEGCTSLYKAASRGRWSRVINLVESGADPNTENEDGRRALHVAAEKGYEDIVKFLVDQGADVNAECDLSQTALHAVMHNDQCISAVASGMGYLNIVKYLIEQGSKIDKQDHRGYTPLHIAAANGHLEIVKYLTDQKCSVKEVDNAGLTPLSLAAKHGHLDTVKYLANGRVDEKAACSVAFRSGHWDIVKFFKDRKLLRLAASSWHLESVQYLVQQGVDINSCYEKGWTPLDYAIQNNNCEVIDYLLTNGAKANQGKEESPLCMASRLGHLDAVKVLISRGISVNAESHRGQIPLHAAAANGRIQVVEILNENGSDLNKTDIEGCTPLHAAVQNGHLEVVRYLIWKGAINIKYRGMTSLYIAAQSGHLDIVDLLLSNGADVNGENDTGCIPLHAAAANGSLEIVEKLIKHGSNVNKMADNGWTPLHAAVYGGRLDVVQYLISNGATKTSFEGMTVLYIAVQRGHIDLIEYFATTGCDVNHGTDCGKTPLSAACYNGDMDSMKMLVTHGACINQANRNEWTSVHSVAQEGHLLVENGADTNAKDRDEITPLQAAEVGGHEDITQFFIRLIAEILHDEQHNDTAKSLRSDRHCSEMFRSSWMPEVSVCDRFSDINGESYYPMPPNFMDASSYLQNLRRTLIKIPYLDTMKTTFRSARVSYVSKPKTQHGDEVPATDDFPVTSMTSEKETGDLKPGIKSERRNNGNCFSILTVLHRAVLALVFYFACFPILVAGNSRLTEPVTLDVGTRGVVTFYLERPFSSLQFSLFYTIQFGSKARPFSINGQYDVDGFKNPSQISRFTTIVIDRDTSPCVNMTIDDVDTIDGDQYIFTAVWRSLENVLHDTQKKEVIVQRSPGPADCFITLSDHGDNEFPYELHCSAKTGSMPTTLTCFQNDQELVKVQNITDKRHTTRAIFFLPHTTHFSCCSHDIASRVGAATCNDFEWPPGYSGIPSTGKATSRSKTVSEQSNRPADSTPPAHADSDVGSGARKSFMVPSHWHFLYLLMYLLVFVINIIC